MYTNWLHRGGLTTACGSVNARSGRWLNATVLPRAAWRNSHACVRLTKQEKINRRYILHPAQSFILSINRLKAHHLELRILTRRRVASTFAPRLFSLWSFDVCSLVGEALLSPPQLLQRAAAVSTQHLCRHRHRRKVLGRSLFCVVSLSLPLPSLSAQLLILLTSHQIHEPQSTCCIQPGVDMQYLKDPIPKIRRGQRGQIRSTSAIRKKTLNQTAA